MSITAADLDARCAPLIQAVRSRGVVAQTALDAVIPSTSDDAEAWLQCYAQLRVWMAAPDGARDAHAEADAQVTRALREAPIPVPEITSVAIAVYPKSFATLVQLQVLDTQLDRLVARLARQLDNDAPLEQIDAAVPVSAAVAYTVQLILWIWTTPGAGMPFDPMDPTPQPPPHIVELSTDAQLAIHQAIAQFGAQVQALHVLIDPLPAREGGRRPSWSGLFEGLGAESHLDPRELAVSYSLEKVLAMSRIAADRHRPADPS